MTLAVAAPKLSGHRPDPTVSERLAGYSCDLAFEDIPPDAVDVLKTVVVHDLVVGIVGSHTPEAEQAVEFIRSDAGAPGGSTVIGHRVTASPIDAAFANAVIIRALNQEDTTMSAFVHSGALLIPAALAIGEHVGSTGKEVITALIAGYEVAGKLALPWSVPATRAVRTPSHVYGAFGVAVTAARLMGLDREQTATAIAYAGNVAAMVTAGFLNHQYGVVVRNGVTAAYLGQSRAPAPRDALEGVPGFFDAQVGAVPPDLDERLASLGSGFEVMTSRLKTFPCSGHNALAAGLLQRVLRDHDLAAGDIAVITVHRAPTSNAVVQSHHDSTGPFTQRDRAVSSVPFALAAVLLDGQLTPTRFDHHFDDPAIAELAQQVRTRRDESVGRLDMRVDVETADGCTYSCEGDDSDLPAPEPADIVTFHDSKLMTTDDVATLTAVVSRLERLDALAPLTKLLVRKQST